MIKNFVKKLCYLVIIVTLSYEALGRPHGLKNFGSTCYINSVLQAFYALDPVTAYLLTLQKNPYPATPEEYLAHYYFTLLKQLALLPPTPEGTKHAANVLDYVDFVNEFKPVVLESTQADNYVKIQGSTVTDYSFTAEDINYIKRLDKFYNTTLADFIYQATRKTTDPLSRDVTKSLDRCPQGDVPEFTERLVSALIQQDTRFPFSDTTQALQNHPLGKLLRIEIFKTIKCVDSTHTKTDQEARLNIQTTYYDEKEKKEKTFKTLQACIEQTLSGQIIDYTPHGSSTSKRCTEKQQLIYLSDIVILALNRFGYDITTKKGIKYKHKIIVPFEYDFARHLPEDYSAQTKYELIAAVEHRGGYDSGHYIAYVRQEKQWYICNDEHVFAVNTKDIVDYSDKWGAGPKEHYGIDYAYVYFYQKSTAPFQPKVPPKVDDTTKQLIENLQTLTKQLKFLEQSLLQI